MFFDSIAKIVAARTGCDVSSITPESKFTDLGVDSLDTVDMLMNLEEELGFEIVLNQPVATVGDLDRFIQKVKEEA
ncbi:MAG: acyl carrier protein [Sphaerochaetaceae bacterium]|nr:acyl carrier protein [Sphaerochaetaceae bacterium]